MFTTDFDCNLMDLEAHDVVDKERNIKSFVEFRFIGLAFFALSQRILPPQTFVVFLVDGYVEDVDFVVDFIVDILFLSLDILFLFLGVLFISASGFACLKLF